MRVLACAGFPCAAYKNTAWRECSDFQDGSRLTSTWVYIPCRYWLWCTSYSFPDISYKCWNLKNTGAVGYTRRLIGSRSGDAFEIKMGAEEEDNDEEQTKRGKSESGSPVGEKQEGEEEK